MARWNRPGITMQRTTLSFLALLLLVTATRAQITTGSVRGIVEDSTGARVGGALVEVRMAASASVRRATSDSHGEFLLENLAPGQYTMTVSASGFATASAEVVAAVSTVRDICLLYTSRCV